MPNILRKNRYTVIWTIMAVCRRMPHHITQRGGREYDCCGGGRCGGTAVQVE
jgi:hypothetical protein